MQLNKFLEKFLPEYEARLNRFRIEEGYAPIAFEINGVKEFCVQNFPEALQNFTNIICEKQRESCAMKCISRTFSERMCIEEAGQPQINEL